MDEENLTPREQELLRGAFMSIEEVMKSRSDKATGRNMTEKEMAISDELVATYQTIKNLLEVGS